MRVLDIFFKDVRQMVRDWKAAMFLVVMPILFTVIFGFAFGGFGGGQEDNRLPVGLLDHDKSPVSAQLVELLNRSTVIRLVQLKDNETSASIDKQVRDGKVAAAAIVPAGYGDMMLAGESAALEVVAGSSSSGGLAAQNELQAGCARLAGAAEAARLSAEAAAAQNPFVDEAARSAFLLDGLTKAVQAWANPPITVVVGESGATTREEAAPANAFAHSSASMMIQFAVAGIMSAGEVMVLERKSRSLQRLLTTAVSRGEIILGHFLTMFVMSLVQFIILIGFAQLALKVDYMREAGATLLVMFTLALFIASLGLLVGTLAKTQEQVILYSMILMFVLAGLGGAWMPLEYTGKAFQTIGHLMPTAWGIDGFENIILRGLGISSILVAAGVLLAYAAVCFGAAVWKFRTE